MKATQQVVKKYLVGWVGGLMEGWKPCWMNGWVDGLVYGSESQVKDCLQQSKSQKWPVFLIQVPNHSKITF